MFDSNNNQRVSWALPQAPVFSVSAKDKSGFSRSYNRSYDSSSLALNPLLPLSESLSESAKALQNSAATALTTYAKENPAVGRLVAAHQTWESNLRTEAQKRLGGFQPPAPLLQQTGLLDEDWDLLKRVKSSSRALTSSSMKRSASADSLDSMGSEPSSSAATVRKPSKQNAYVRGQSQDFDSGYGPRSFGISRSSRMGPRAPGQGMPRVATSPVSLRELSETLNVEAARNIEAFLSTSKQAIQKATSSIQQTATNCQNNLQALSTIFAQNMANHPNLQSALSSSKAVVTWSLANSSDPLTGALVPWAVFPKYLRAREADASSDADVQSSKDWVTPLENYMLQLDQRQRNGQKRSVRDPGRQVCIVTTAALPWMTGTSVNPLLRAAYLAADTQRKVTLVLPWLSKMDQSRVFPNNMEFETPEQQEVYVRDWVRERTGLPCNFKVTFYPGRYAAEKGSILPVGDITQCIPDHEADVAVLEEPEHLNWYHHGKRWTDKFNHVVGVMHTNYLDYARREESGHIKEAILKYVNAWVCRIHCNKVIKLSDAVQPLPREQTMFIHGVSPSFLKVGAAKARMLPSSEAVAAEGLQPSQQEERFGKGVYFLGKVLWAKGYTELLDRMKEHTARTGDNVPVDVFGSGPDLKAVVQEAGDRHLALKFNGAKDHADASIQDYKVFINPSLSDVVATTTAEALAMGKFVVCAEHPSNKFFESFSNCLIYRNSEEFSQCLKQALETDPKPLSPSELHSLTWEAATERFLDVADMQHKSPPLEAMLETVLHAAHNSITGMEFLRKAIGAGSGTRDTPARVTDYQPCRDEVGGFFDNHARARAQMHKK